MPTDYAEFVDTIAGPLGGFWLLVGGMNILAAAIGAFGRRRAWLAWLPVGLGFAAMGLSTWLGAPPVLPSWAIGAINAVFTPVTFTIGWIGLLAAFYMGRRFFVRPIVAFTVLNISLLALGLSVTEPNFQAVVTRPDNVPIVALVYLFGFFLWAAGWQAARNDEHLARGEPTEEAQFDGKALTWPDLVYIELICTILVTAGLVVWSVVLKAPLEEPANPVLTPNPSKAPWYFVGLQEMLVYADPWYAGVVVPCLMFLGLVAIPYLDPNPKGNGYYTVDQRPFAMKSFLFGMMGLWVMLIVIGTFLRGPNWTFFAPFEYRDPHLIVTQANVTLSEYAWGSWLGREMPTASADVGALAQVGVILLREMVGVVVLLAYFVGLPWLLAATWLKPLREQMGRTRYIVMVALLLVMFSLPLKMILRWTLNLSHVVAIPEWSLNF